MPILCTEKPSNAQMVFSILEFIRYEKLVNIITLSETNKVSETLVHKRLFTFLSLLFIQLYILFIYRRFEFLPNHTYFIRK